MVNVFCSFVLYLNLKLASYCDILQKQRKIELEGTEEQFDCTWVDVMSDSPAVFREPQNAQHAHYIFCTFWSSAGVGFAFYLDRQLMWIGSRRNAFWSPKVSSFLDGFNYIAWALNPMQRM